MPPTLLPPENGPSEATTSRRYALRGGSLSWTEDAYVGDETYQTCMPTSAVASTFVMTSGKVNARLLGVNDTLPKALAWGLTSTSRMTAPTAGKEG